MGLIHWFTEALLLDSCEEIIPEANDRLHSEMQPTR